jgi:5-methylcytosine-specific restriction endonuclease McrA
MANFNKKNWLISQLRRLSVKYPPRLKVLNAGKTTYYIKSKKNTDVKRVSFECSSCHTKGLTSKQIALDHVLPVVDVKNGWTNWEDFINRLFCDESNFSLICEPCHLIKSGTEMTERAFNRKQKKLKNKLD